MKPGRILMECPDCDAKLEVARRIGDPPTAVRMYVPCGKHDRGRVHQPHYFDGEDGIVIAEEKPE